MDKQKLSVLYVEDNPDIHFIGRIALVDIGGFDVCVCEDGPAALAAVEQFAPDLLLLDMQMPGMNGHQLLERLRATPAAATTPAVFMTGSVMPDEVAAYRAWGAVDVIVKPFDPLTLADTLSALVGGR